MSIAKLVCPWNQGGYRKEPVSDEIMIGHPDLQRTLEIADRFATELSMYAG